MFLATTGASADDPWYFPMVSVPDDDPTDWPPDDPTGGGGDPDPSMPTTTTTVLPTTTTTVPPGMQRLRDLLNVVLDRTGCVAGLTGVPTEDWTRLATQLQRINPGLTAQAIRTAMAAHELGVALLREVPVRSGTVDYPHIDIAGTTIVVDPRFYELTSFTFNLADGALTMTGDDGRVFASVASLAIALGHNSTSIVPVLNTCFPRPQTR
jgi:hypothetical protein